MADEAPPSSLGRQVGLAALMLSVSILLSRILGFARDILVTNYYGAGFESDAYLTAFVLPEVMNYFLTGGTLSITFIPLFSSYMSKQDEGGGWHLFSVIATVMGGALGVATVVGWVYADTIVPWIAPGFESQAQLDLTVKMTRIVLPAQLAFYWGGLIQATLFVREKFWPAAVSPLVYNVCIILGGVLLREHVGVAGFSVGVLVGAVLGPFGVPLWAARKEVKYRPTLQIGAPGFRRFILLTLPLMLGATLISADEWLLKQFGSSTQGAITWLNHSRKLMMVISGLIGQAVGQAALPYLSRLFDQGEEGQMGELISQGLQRIAFLSLIAAGGLMAVSKPLVFVLYQRGAFTPEDASKTALLLMVFCLGLTAWTMQSLAVRGFYARQDTKTPMITGVSVLGVMIPVYWGLNSVWGPTGLAVASVLGVSLNLAALVVVYRRKVGRLPVRNVLGGGGRGLGAALIALGVAWAVGWGLEGELDITSTWQGIGAIAAQGGAFGGVVGVYLVARKPEEFAPVWEKVARKLGRRQS